MYGGDMIADKDIIFTWSLVIPMHAKSLLKSKAAAHSVIKDCQRCTTMRPLCRRGSKVILPVHESTEGYSVRPKTLIQKKFQKQWGLYRSDLGHGNLAELKRKRT